MTLLDIALALRLLREPVRIPGDTPESHHYEDAHLADYRAWQGRPTTPSDLYHRPNE